MNLLRIAVAPAALSLFVAGCGGTVELPDDLPAATRAAIEGAFAPEDILEVEAAEGSGGAEWWEVEAPSQIDVYFDGAGTVPKIEAEIPLVAVPEVIRASGASEAGWRIEEAELVVLNGELLYELEFEGAGGREMDVYYRPDGTEVLRYEEGPESEGSGE